MNAEDEVVVRVESLKKHFPLRQGFFASLRGIPPLSVKAVDGISFKIRHGEILSLAGESGCGKTTTARLVTLLEEPTEGSITFMGRDVATLDGGDLRVFRKNIQMIFQDPYESLNPRLTVQQAVMEPLTNHSVGEGFEERIDLVIKALDEAGLSPPEKFLARFPHELSGGQRQRVAIARALVLRPKMIVADEPVSMLDVSIRAGVLNLMLELRDKFGFPFLFITHDLAIARYMSDNLGIMYLGRIVEIGNTEEVIAQPAHPYTKALLSAVPVPDPEHKHGRVEIRGEVPSPIDLPSGCRFNPRCVYARDICREEPPPVVEVSEGHFSECHFAQEVFAGTLEPERSERSVVRSSTHVHS